MDSKLPTLSIDDIPELKISGDNIEKNPDQNTVRSVMKHIRNGIAHGRIEQKSQSGKIVGISIRDRKDCEVEDSFIINLDIDELKKLIGYVAEVYINAGDS